MTASSVVDLLRLLDVAGVFPWVDGGWGVDALLGYQSRPHADLDIVIPESAVPAAQEALTAVGFTDLRNWLPTALAMRHADGREVDLHPITPTEDGGGNQRLFPPEPPFHYDAPTTGVINRTQVTCVDAATQLRAHVGYDPQPEDHADVAALATRFRLPLPPEYCQPARGSPTGSLPCPCPDGLSRVAPSDAGDVVAGRPVLHEQHSAVEHPLADQF
jgi:lincosamide nucleotidyltransferase A/C/D/E